MIRKTFVAFINNGAIRFLLENSLFLLVGAVAGLVLANVNHEMYEGLAMPMHFAVNDIAMCMFFLLAAKEIRESVLPGGPLAPDEGARGLMRFKRPALPLLATLGGMTGPAATYLIGARIFGAEELVRGWAVPTATDIAFSYLVARFIWPEQNGKKNPAIAFLLLLAIADDAGGLIVLALFYPSSEMHLGWFAALFATAAGISLILWKRLKIVSFWPYLMVPGVILWIGFFKGGIHPALALVPLAWMVPHAKSDHGIFAKVDLDRHDTLSEIEHWWKTPVQLILALFGFVNAGVTLSATGLGTWLVLAGLMIGKPLGICLFAKIGEAIGLERPNGMSNRDLVVMGCAAGIGFTVALFVSVVAFPTGTTQDAVKMGALGSFGSAFVAIGMARLLKVGRYQ